jgi:hypothetical protein
MRYCSVPTAMVLNFFYYDFSGLLEYADCKVFNSIQYEPNILHCTSVIAICLLEDTILFYHHASMIFIGSPLCRDVCINFYYYLTR